MRGMKIRLMAMGTIISVLSLVLMTVRGIGTGSEVLLGVGVVLLFLGLIWA